MAVVYSGEHICQKCGLHFFFFFAYFKASTMSPIQCSPIPEGRRGMDTPCETVADLPIVSLVNDAQPSKPCES